jgi:hypothetical protein
MNASVIAGSLLSGLVLVAPLPAQQVSANVVVRSGPVAGHVVVGDGYSTYRRRPAPHYREARVIVIERSHRHRHAGYWKRHGFRPVTIYYTNGRYYDRWYGHPRGVRRVVVYERGGRYYDACERDHGRHRDGDDRYDDDRHGDWDD